MFVDNDRYIAYRNLVGGIAHQSNIHPYLPRRSRIPFGIGDKGLEDVFLDFVQMGDKVVVCWVVVGIVAAVAVEVVDAIVVVSGG